ncbi:MAG: hypothetical protein ACXW6V_11840 [Candidatus Binatia bacterium]
MKLNKFAGEIRDPALADESSPILDYDQIHHFDVFLSNRCRQIGRRSYIEALKLQTSSARIAPLGLLRARSSSTWPSKTNMVITAAASK